MSSVQQRRIVLVGGGHSHAQVVKALHHDARPDNVHITLIDIETCASYSGMVPGCVAKLYRPDETLIQLRPLARWASVEFLQRRVVDIDLDKKHLLLSSVSSDEKSDTTSSYVEFDAVSFDIGSGSRGLHDTPGAQQYCIPTRPISQLVSRIDAAEQALMAGACDAHVVVVGGGAAGVELCMAMRARWQPLFNDNDASQHSLHVTLVVSGAQLMPSETDKCRQALLRVLQDRNIKVRYDSVVERLTQQHVCLRGGSQLAYTHCIWAAGACAHNVAYSMAKHGLAVSERGWIRVNPQLQSVSHPFVFAAGDCATIEGLPNGKRSPPKAGVYAVRAGPVLISNLVRYCQSLDVSTANKLTQWFAKTKLVAFKPQEDFLKLLMCGDGTCLGFRFGVPIYGKWVWHLKDWIDRRFMNLFDENNLPELNQRQETEEDQNTASAESQLQEVRELTTRTDDNADNNVVSNGTQEMTHKQEIQE